MDWRNYSEWKNMREAILEALPNFDFMVLRPMLWHDELRDVFALAKSIEVYLYSRTILGCYCWSRKTYTQMAKRGLIFDNVLMDDGVYAFRADLRNLPLVLAVGGMFRRRPHVHGVWIRERERQLGHQIVPFAPEVLQSSPRELVHSRKDPQPESDGLFVPARERDHLLAFCTFSLYLA